MVHVAQAGKPVLAGGLAGGRCCKFGTKELKKLLKDMFVRVQHPYTTYRGAGQILVRKNAVGYTDLNIVNIYVDKIGLMYTFKYTNNFMCQHIGIR